MKTKKINKKGGHLSLLVSKLSTIWLGNLLASKGVIKGGDGVIQGAKGMIKTGQDF